MTTTEQEREREQRDLLKHLEELADKNRRAYKQALEDFRRSFTLS
ncbi:hypothetical protein N5C81_14990 [Rhizobium pusense]|nr:hypothetical protein [Agrobacterium pusense]MDH1268929.1 hypothetical protein [Agrobacterium pusense]